MHARLFQSLPTLIRAIATSVTVRVGWLCTVDQAYAEVCAPRSCHDGHGGSKVQKRGGNRMKHHKLCLAIPTANVTLEQTIMMR